MNPFTDDDLKRFKQASQFYQSDDSAPHIWQYVPALLARLEAAEKVVKYTIDNGWGKDQVLEAWRKAAGK